MAVSSMLKELGKLKEGGALNEEHFELLKQLVLSKDTRVSGHSLATVAEYWNLRSDGVLDDGEYRKLVLETLDFLDGTAWSRCGSSSLADAQPRQVKTLCINPCMSDSSSSQIQLVVSNQFLLPSLLAHRCLGQNPAIRPFVRRFCSEKMFSPSRTAAITDRLSCVVWCMLMTNGRIKACLLKNRGFEQCHKLGKQAICTV